MSFPRYAEYKDSGVEWLEKVPNHWNIYQARRLFEQRRDSALPSDEQLSATQKYGVIPQTLFMAQEDQKVVLALSGLDNFKHLEADDFVISLRSFQGGIERSRYAGCVSPAYTVLRPQKDLVPNYWEYLLKCSSYIAALQTTTEGIRDGKNISYTQFGSLSVPLAPETEQTAIATFLDRETAKIDALIAEQEKLIALLAEKRQATISHAVTKGLNPNAPMKDSGVAWLGEVPEHWDVVSLKHLVATPITDGPHETPSFPDEGIPFVSAEAVSGGVINFEKIRGYISREDHLRYSEKYKPQLHDIYMVKSGATTGITAIVETEQEFNIWSPLAAIRCDVNKADPYFVLSALRSRNFQEGVALNWSFGTQQNIGMGVLGDLPIAIPSLIEQREIAQTLSYKLPKLQELGIEAEFAITLLKERRSALITAAVTGQIDVRNLTPEVPA